MPADPSEGVWNKKIGRLTYKKKANFSETDVTGWSTTSRWFVGDVIRGGKVPARIVTAVESFRSAITRCPATSRQRNSARTWRQSATSSCEKTVQKFCLASARRSKTRQVRFPARIFRCSNVIRTRDDA